MRREPCRVRARYFLRQTMRSKVGGPIQSWGVADVVQGDARVVNWASGNAAATVTVARGAARIIFSGDVSAQVLRDVSRFMAKRIDPGVVRVVMLRMELARSAWHPSEMMAFLQDHMRCPLMRLPRAIVVRPEDAMVCQVHAWAAAELGLVRAIFTDVALAAEWVSLRQQALGYSTRSSAR